MKIKELTWHETYPSWEKKYGDIAVAHGLDYSFHYGIQKSGVNSFSLCRWRTGQEDCRNNLGIFTTRYAACIAADEHHRKMILNIINDWVEQ